MRTSFGHAQGPSACALAGAALSLASPPSPSKGGANAWRNGRTIWIVDAHRGDGERFIVRTDEKLTAFLELESALLPAVLVAGIGVPVVAAIMRQSVVAPV